MELIQPIEISDSEAQKFKMQHGDKCDIWAGEHYRTHGARNSYPSLAIYVRYIVPLWYEIILFVRYIVP